MNKRITGLFILVTLYYSIVSPLDFTKGGDKEMDIDDLFKKIEAAHIGITDYRCTLLSMKGDGDKESMVYFFKKPKQIRMELISPHKGAILTHRSGEPLVYVSPFRWFRRLVISFRLDNPLVMSSNGHQVDESDMGSFIEMILMPAVINGAASILDANSWSPDSYLINIDFKEETKGRPHKFTVWIDKRLLLPVRIDSYYPDGRLMESVTFKDLTVNSGLSDDIFLLKR